MVIDTYLMFIEITSGQFDPKAKYTVYNGREIRSVSVSFMASRFTIYYAKYISSISYKISYIGYKISYLGYKISTTLIQIYLIYYIRYLI